MTAGFYYKTKITGQTLVETVVGVFVLTIGITTALGLSAAIFNASSSAVKQVIGAGLAREGVEAVFSMRGTNWLKGTLSTNCYNYANGGTLDAYCHKDWQKLSPVVGGSYDLDPPTGSKSYTLGINPNAGTTESYWLLAQQPGGNPDFRLYYDATISSGLLYKTTSSGAVQSDYFREIMLTEETDSTVPAAPYYKASIGPRLRVNSRVWWNDRGCPGATTWAATVPKCRIELVSFLTNWRNY